MAAARTRGRRIDARAAPAGAFGAFPPAMAAALQAVAVHRCWKDGDSVLPKGAVVPSVLAVLHGRLRIAAAAEEGHEIFFRWQLPGEIVGLATAVSGLAFPVSAIAFDHCETLEVEREVLLAHLQADAGAALAAARLLASHAYDLIHLVTQRTQQTLTERVNVAAQPRAPGVGGGPGRRPARHRGCSQLAGTPPAPARPRQRAARRLPLGQLSLRRDHRPHHLRARLGARLPRRPSPRPGLDRQPRLRLPGRGRPYLPGQRPGAGRALLRRLPARVRPERG